MLSSWLRYAAHNGVIAKPTLRFTIPEMKGELVAVAMSDVDRLIATSKDPILRAAVILAAEAGLRAGELRGLQWTDVKGGEVTVRRSLDTATDEVILPKHNKRRKVPVSPRLADALARPPRRGLWVLSQEEGAPLPHGTNGGLYRRLVALYVAAGVERPPSPVHCLRHTYGTEMAAAGVPLPVIQELMGHANITTTRRYIHVNEAQKRAAVASVFAWQPRGSEKEETP